MIYPKYCVICGEKLYWKHKRTIFNTKTGQPIQIQHLKCPNIRWYNIFGHIHPIAGCGEYSWPIERRV